MPKDNTIELVRCLLADISAETGIQLGLPDEVGIEWFLVEGPKLDKTILQAIEHGDLSLVNELVPAWLMPLAKACIPAVVENQERRSIFQKEIVLLYRALRQVLLFCYKIEYAYTKQQVEERQLSFLQIEAEVKDFDDNASYRSDPFAKRVRSTIQRVLNQSSRTELLECILPAHGPGAVSPRKFSWDKGDCACHYRSIEEYYPYFDWFYGALNSVVDPVTKLGHLPTHDDIKCRMTAVPKDSRGPRIICVHPAEAMWIQQGQRKWLERLIRRSPLTKDAIFLNDQGPNGERARYASASRSLATIDLKDASDRLSLGLFKYLFAGFEDILCSARATVCRTLDGSFVRLAKFAPMGNALTFPVESLVFWAIAHTSLTLDCGIPSSESDVTVFGDDIIIPAIGIRRVCERLEQFGFKVNYDKTFYRGSFRESCGVDAYHGIDVTPLRLRKADITGVLDAVAACDLAKRARIRGYDTLAAKLYSLVGSVTGKRLSVTNEPMCSGIVEYRDISFKEVCRINGPKYAKFCKQTYRPMVRQLQVSAVVYRGKSAWWHVLEALVRLESRGDAECPTQIPFWDEGKHKYTTFLSFRRGRGANGLVYTLPNRVRSRFGWTPARC